MKYAFTTLGCPDWDLQTVVRNARDMGFDGIDFRGLGPHKWDADGAKWVGLDMDITANDLFTKDLNATKKLIADAGLEVAGVSSGAFLARREGTEAAMDEARRYIDLAVALDSKIVRVFGGSSFEKEGISREDATKILAESLSALGADAGKVGVTVALETHDAWTGSPDVKAVMDLVASPAVGVLWDTHHPYRMVNESPATTWGLLGDRICYTHVKDSQIDEDGSLRMCGTGAGTIPLKEIVDALKQGGYDGYLTLEWEKMWHMELAEPEVAFPQYLAKMKELVGGA